MHKRVCWLTINRSCNLRCTWCYAQSLGFQKKQDMEYSLYKSIIPIVNGFDIKKVIFIGGEPTIHPDFLNMLKHAKSHHITSSCITNGIKFKDKLFLKEAYDNGLRSITLSLKAPTANLYKKWTGIDSLRDVMQAIENIKFYNIPLTISLVLSPEIYDYLNDLADLLKKMNVKVYIDSERPVIINGQIKYDCDTKKIIQGYQNVIETFEREDIPYIFKASLPFCLFPKDVLKHLKEKKCLEAGCQMLSSSGLIFDTNGDLLACNQLCQSPLAKYNMDFNDFQSLSQALAKEKICTFYKLVTSYPHKKCTNCKDWSECGGGCRINWLYKKMISD